MHNCTWACGNTVSIASGNPFSPSTQAMNTSFTPRLFSSVNTCSQNLAPSCAEVLWTLVVRQQLVDQFFVDGHVAPLIIEEQTRLHKNQNTLNKIRFDWVSPFS